MDFTKESTLKEIKAKVDEVVAATDIDLDTKNKALEILAGLRDQTILFIPIMVELGRLEKEADKLREKYPELKKYI